MLGVRTQAVRMAEAVLGTRGAIGAERKMNSHRIGSTLCARVGTAAIKGRNARNAKDWEAGGHVMAR